MKHMKYFIRLCRLCHKDYDVSLDYGAHNGFHFVYGNDLPFNGCDVMFI